MPSRELTEILALVPGDFADPDADYRAVRAMMAPFHGHPVPAHVEVTEVALGGVRCAWYEDTRQPRARRQRVVFHCHGGGLVSSPLDDYHFYGAMLAEQLEARVVMPDYRLAPEHIFPAAHRDCADAYRGLLQSGTDPDHVVVSGDSCGGLLGLGALLTARDEHLPSPACFLSISGWFDVSVPHPVEGRDPFLSAAWVRNRGREYAAGQVVLEDPRLSPVHADLAGLPPLYLPAGQYDTLRKGTEALAQAAMRAGVAVTAESWPGMVHGWQGLVTAGVPEAVAAFARARAYLDDLGA